MPTTRREFLEASLRAGLAFPAARLLSATEVAAAPAALARGRPIFPVPARGWRGDSSLAAALRSGATPLPVTAVASPLVPPSDPLPPLSARFADLPRHFIFEYYPWYAADPIRHWDQWDRVPPFDIASHYVPRLGPYDSRSREVLERHAQWIAEAGAGAINLSWWGPGSFEDRLAPLVMDVMRDHGIKVTFHLEPYSDDHGRRFAQDVLYLVREYGDKRRWDAFLLLRDEDGSEGPVLKGFRSILPEQSVDCHGVTRQVPDYTPDGVWRRELEDLRRALAGDFDRVTLLADTLDTRRAAGAGFDGVAVYDNFVPPSAYAPAAAAASAEGLVFSFNVNPGFDAIEPRVIEPDSCYAPTPFEPPAPDLDFARAEDRERAASLSARRIRESLAATLRVQTDPRLLNAERGFFLVYLTSFNEWHEGHAFEPMQDAAALRPEERAFGYHNPADGSYRLATLGSGIRSVVAPQPQVASPAYA